jgi:PBP1b-binding outer membrane lipoprotein LpoB
MIKLILTSALFVSSCVLFSQTKQEPTKKAETSTTAEQRSIKEKGVTVNSKDKKAEVPPPTPSKSVTPAEKKAEPKKEAEKTPR